MHFAISSNHFSVDQQAADALDWLRVNHPDDYTRLRRDFSEPIVWCGSWFDTERMRVDVEWGSWLIDAIEETGRVWWEEGEPWADDGGAPSPPDGTTCEWCESGPASMVIGEAADVEIYATDGDADAGRVGFICERCARREELSR